MSKSKKNASVDALLEELDTALLKFELESRDYVCLEEDEYQELISESEGKLAESTFTSLPNFYAIERTYAFGDKLREHLLDITGQGHYVTNEELLNELRDLL